MSKMILMETMETRSIYNPIQKDTVSFLKTGAETNGAYTLVEVTLAPGGGVGLHYHKTYSEKFTGQQGSVEIVLGKQTHTLQAGQSATAAPMVNHLFRNVSKQPCSFRVEIRPACRGFEQALQIGYGLARDGKCKANGFPKNRLVLAWLFQISESSLPGWMHIFEKLLHWQAQKARQKKWDQYLVAKYVQW